MRRVDKEVFDADIIRDFLNDNNIVRIAFDTGTAPYIVPLGYGYDYDGKELILYMHGARDGRKIDLAEKAPYVGFEIDCSSEVIQGETPKDTSIRFESIIGTGNLHIIEDVVEKEHCFNRIMYHFTGNGQHDYSKKVLEMTAAFKLVADAFSMKKG